MKTKKIIVAGPLVREVIYSRAGSREDAVVRQAKRKTSTEAQQRANARYSWEKLELMLAANYMPGDLVVTLTFDDDHLPEDRKTAAARCKKFRKELGELRRAAGSELRMIWTIEHRSGEGRWHVHAVINRLTGNDGILLVKLWGKGSVHIEHLKEDREKNHVSLAKYMAKESEDRENSRRAWSYTRSCRKPETVVDRNVEDETLQLPKGAILIEQESHSNEYGTWQYIRYYVPEDAPGRTQRAARIFL